MHQESLVALFKNKRAGFAGKNWAGVRREERRETPQPVVFFQGLYAGQNNRFIVFRNYHLLCLCRNPLPTAASALKIQSETSADFRNR